MGKKWLKGELIQEVAELAAEATKEAGQFLRETELIERIYHKRPDLSEFSVRKAIAKAKADGLITWVKRKGYTIVPAPAGAESSQKASAKPPVSGKAESAYYHHVSEWFKRRSSCLVKLKKGREWGMPDVSVVRGSPSKFLDDIELITVEVKRGNVTSNDLSQAYKYSKVAHRCYLAADVKKKLEDLRPQAERIGIGLLFINPDNPGDITELLSPPWSGPIATSLQEHLASVFDLVSCTFCGTYFAREKNKTQVLSRKSAASGEKITRFVCTECFNLLLHGKKMEAWKG